jgi:hypothetical protein
MHLHDENGQLSSLPAGWTDVAAADPFVVVAAGLCPFTSQWPAGCRGPDRPVPGATAMVTSVTTSADD